jgi:hypothetical protein
MALNRIKFSLRTPDGTIVATSFTDPIRITDDHKTDTKVKARSDAVPRGRKGRASAASSRRQSPAPSEGESVQSLSEAGALMQKQTPSVRGKPYDRPPSQSPAMGTGNLPFDLMMSTDGNAERPRFGRQQSSSSLHSGGSMAALPLPSEMEGYADFSFDQVNTVSPGALRRPNFGFTALDGGYGASSATHSASSSNVASPVAGLRPLADDMLMMHDAMASPQSPGGFSGLQNGHGLGNYLADQDISQTLTTAMDGLFDVSSRNSLASSSFNDAASNSGFSAFRDGASGYYSDSGVVPEDMDLSMEGFLDFSGGEGQGLAGPAFSQSPAIPFNLDLGQSPLSGQGRGLSPLSQNGAYGYQPPDGGLGHDADAQAQIQDILSSFSQNREASASPTSAFNPLSPQALHQSASPQTFMNTQVQPQVHAPMHASGPIPQQPPRDLAFDIPPQPLVSHVIPAEGPMAGGTQVAVAGQRFSPGMTVMFGSRVAKTMVISETFCTCELPPAAEPGLVDVAVQGALRVAGEKVETFRYLGMDREM